MAWMINAAVIHVLNLSRNVITLSEETMNLEDEAMNGYVEKMVRKISGESDSQKGTFQASSYYLQALKAYEAGEMSFIDATIQIMNQMKDRLKEVSAKPLAVLFISYEEENVPYLAMVLLENKTAWTVTTVMHDESLYNALVYADDILPSPENKVRAFALVNTLNNNLMFMDQIKWESEDVHIMAEVILQCTSGRSHKEVLNTITSITKDIAEEYDQDPTVLLTKVKSYMKQSAEEDEPIAAEDMAVHVFNESDQMQNDFLSRSLEEDLPKEMDVPKKIISREMKTQHIHTDTGVTISFPVEMASDPSKMEFIHHDDGTITIELRHIGHITNRK